MSDKEVHRNLMNDTICLARVFKNGEECRCSVRRKGIEFCGRHINKSKYGKITENIPVEYADKFTKKLEDRNIITKDIPNCGEDRLIMNDQYVSKKEYMDLKNYTEEHLKSIFRLHNTCYDIYQEKLSKLEATIISLLEENLKVREDLDNIKQELNNNSLEKVIKPIEKVIKPDESDSWSDDDDDYNLD